MFIKRQQHPSIEFSPEEGQQAPTLVHYFSDRGDPFKSVLPLLAEDAGEEEERVLVVESPLAEVVNWTIELHSTRACPWRMSGTGRSSRPSRRHSRRQSLRSTGSSTPG